MVRGRRWRGKILMRKPLTTFDRRIGRDPEAWPFGLESPLASQPRRTDSDGWPLPPRISSAWGQRRAIRLYRLMRGGAIARFSGELLSTLDAGIEGRWKDARTPRAWVLAELGSYGYALRWEWKARNETLSFGGFLSAPPGRYLGDPVVVRGLVDDLIKRQLANVRNEIGWEEINAEERRLAIIFAGQDPSYTVIGEWNTYPGLGASARQHIGATYPEFDLVETLVESFFQLRQCLIKVFVARREGLDERRVGPDVEPYIEALAGFTTAVLIGLPVDGWLHELVPTKIAETR